MTPEQAKSALAAHLRQTAALSQAAGLLSWDQETMMPERGAEARSEQLAALEAAIHERRCDPRIPEWAEALGDRLTPLEAANRREALRSYERARKIPLRLATELARQTAMAHGVWAAAKEAERFADFAPTLGRIIALKREEAACLAQTGADLYDALLQGFEPDMTTEACAALLGALRPRLSALRAALADRPAPAMPQGPFAHEAQIALSRQLATCFCYDWTAGRLDEAVHPFSMGQGGDVRITTRVSPDNPFEAIYSTIHEAGHAVYEQRIDPALAFSPAGTEASMGVHESQSRMFENQMGRSRAFAEWLWPRFCDAFGPAGLAGPEDLWRAANRFETGFRRTKADEVHYNLHVILRFDLERALISGDLAITDLETAWNDRFEADFGRKVPHAGLGVLQDVHWSAGFFGYFPTYSVGNIYAGCLFAALERAQPDLGHSLETGALQKPIGWLTEAVHRHGRVISASALIERATGAPPRPEPLLDYLEAKFAALYP
ncbi:MAG: carboxypeptidase M32 [Pseudomonadota bacterium]